MPRFGDHFSSSADSYADSRPSYPAELFDCLAREAPRRGTAWDCATGSGQAAGPLAARFGRVIATDASLAQLSRRSPASAARFAAALAEAAPLADGSVDLVTVSQALHWFDFERFFAEVRRVLAPSGLVAAWSYDLLRVDSEVDALVDHVYSEVVGPYWLPERRACRIRIHDDPVPIRAGGAPGAPDVGGVGPRPACRIRRELVGDRALPEGARRGSRAGVRAPAGEGLAPARRRA